MALVLGELEQGLVRLGLDPGLGLNRQGSAMGSRRGGDQHGGAQARPDLTLLHDVSLRQAKSAACSLE
jgi:hypothetical protein